MPLSYMVQIGSLPDKIDRKFLLKLVFKIFVFLMVPALVCTTAVLTGLACLFLVLGGVVLATLAVATIIFAIITTSILSWMAGSRSFALPVLIIGYATWVAYHILKCCMSQLAGMATNSSSSKGAKTSNGKHAGRLAHSGISTIDADPTSLRPLLKTPGELTSVIRAFPFWGPPDGVVVGINNAAPGPSTPRARRARRSQGGSRKPKPAPLCSSGSGTSSPSPRRRRGPGADKLSMGATDLPEPLPLQPSPPVAPVKPPQAATTSVPRASMNSIPAVHVGQPEGQILPPGIERKVSRPVDIPKPKLYLGPPHLSRALPGKSRLGRPELAYVNPLFEI